MPEGLTVERRRANRYPFRMKASVRSLESRALAEPIETWTRDISAKGLLLEFDQQLEIGTRMNLIVELPAEIIGRTVTLRCVSRVVRIEAGPEGKSGIGAVIENYEFVQPAQAGSSRVN